jgi:NH3-dependent NAD+ synthetase
LYVLKQLLDLDWGRTIDDVESFVKNYIEGSRASGAVIGLSGGLRRHHISSRNPYIQL